MNENVVFIKQIEDFIYNGIQEKGYNIFQAYKKCPYILTIFRRLWFRFKLPFSHIWFNNLLKSLNTENIIIYETLIDPSFLNWIKKNNCKSRIIFFYFNIVSTTIKPEQIPDSIEKWSWDKGDCKQYNFQYNEGSGYIPLKLPVNLAPQYDVVFIGRDKGRYNDLLKIQKALKQKGLKTNFHITADNRHQLNSKKHYKGLLSYEDSLKLELNAKAILDFVQKGQVGTTYRTMEAINYSIKLISNNKELKSYNFSYRKIA